MEILCYVYFATKKKKSLKKTPLNPVGSPCSVHVNDCKSSFSFFSPYHVFVGPHTYNVSLEDQQAGTPVVYMHKLKAHVQYLLKTVKEESSANS